MELIVFAISGHTLQIASWRYPNYISSLVDIQKNLHKDYLMLKDHLKLIGFFPMIIFATISSLMLFIKLIKGRGYKFIEFSKLLIIVCSVMLSIYVQALPIGIDVVLRTAIPLYVGIYFLIMLIFYNYKILSIPLILCSAIIMFNENNNSLRYYRDITNTYYNNLISINVDPKLYKVAFLSTAQDTQSFEKIFKELNHLSTDVINEVNTPGLWYPVGRQAGFSTVIFDSNALPESDKKPIEDAIKNIDDCNKNSLYQWTTYRNWLIVKINPIYTSN